MDNWEWKTNVYAYILPYSFPISLRVEKMRAVGNKDKIQGRIFLLPISKAECDVRSIASYQGVV